MIKAVLFDFGQTLADSSEGFRLAEKEAQSRIFSDLALSSWESFLSIYRDAREKFHARSIFSRKSIWQEVYRKHCQEPDSNLLEQWECDYWDRVRENTTVFPETKMVLENLSAKYRLAMITNTQGEKAQVKHRLNQFPEFETFFEIVIVAGESGMPPKPDPVPFLLCLERLSILPHEAVYVGDDWRIDICGARAVGIQPIWIKHHSVRRAWPNVKTSVPVITSLDRLLSPDSIFIKSKGARPHDSKNHDMFEWVQSWIYRRSETPNLDTICLGRI